MMQYLSERFGPGPVFGWLCVVFLALIPLVWILARRTGRHAMLRFSSLEPMRSLAGSSNRLWRWATHMRFVLPLVRTSVIVALIVALARPQSGGGYRDTSEGIAVQMVLDISGSMAEEDFIMDGRRIRRLDAVKRVFEDFVLGRGELRGREGDLIGMTTFAMYADTRCPLTTDLGSVSDLLRATDIPGWVDGVQVRKHMEAGYTALGEAIVLATDDLRRAGEQAIVGVPGAEAAKSRVMILLTDGADNPAPRRGIEPPDPIEAAKVAATLGVKVYTIGAVGSEQTRRAGLGFFPMRRREVDEPTLKEIAQITGGKYFRATDTDSLRTIYDEIGQLERRRTGERIFHDNVRAARVAMLAGLALLMFELLLVNTRYRKIP